VSKSPQQQAYEEQMRQMQQMSPEEQKRAMRRSRISSTGAKEDQVLSANWFQKAKGGFIVLTFAGLVAAIGYQAQKLFRGRQSELIDAFAESMTYCGDDRRQLAATLADYNKQLGPGPYKERMMARYLSALATNLPVGAKAIRALQETQSAMALPDSAMGPAFEAAADEYLKDRPSVLGKLVFLAERACPSAGVGALRSRLPYGAEYVDSLQRMLLEKTFREAVDASGQDVLSATVPADVRELRISQAEAERFLEKYQKEEAEARRKAAMEADEVDELTKAREVLLAKVKEESPEVADGTPGADPPAPATSGDDAPTSGGASDAAAHECSNCGYTIFPAAGREWKFFGEDFKCPQCGAPKSAFKVSED